MGKGYVYSYYNTGCFLQESQQTDPVPPRFGLISDSQDRWEDFWKAIDKLNDNKDGSIYKVFFWGRHGEGVHNVAMQMDKYKLDENNYDHDWHTFWCYLDGDGDFTWGPDASLVEDGYLEAVNVNSVWATELGAGLVPPTTSWCSPLTRCLVMNTITFGGFTKLVKTVVVEDCREKCGKETPEKRRSQTYIKEMFPNFSIEDGFSEDDEVWGNPEGDDVSKRAKNVLNRIFNDDNSGDYSKSFRSRHTQDSLRLLRTS